IEREHLHTGVEKALPPSTPVTHHVIGSNEPTGLLDLRLLLRLQDRAIRARDRDRVLRQGCAGQGEDKRERTRAAELDFGSEANHAVSNYQTVFAAIPTVKQNQPPAAISRTVFVWVARASRVSRAGLRVPRKRTSLWGAQAASLIMPVRLGLRLLA